MGLRPLPESSRPESYGKVLGNLLGVVIALAGIGSVMLARRPSPPEPKPGAVVASAPVEQDVKAKTRKTPAPQVVAPAPTPPPAPRIDQEAVARAEAVLEAATRARAEAEARAVEASKQLELATEQAALDARVVQSLAQEVSEPAKRIDQLAARGGFLKAETEKLKGEVATYAQASRPKAKILSNKTPVARPAEQAEYHFEVRRGRVAYIDLDALIALVKKDVELRIRLADGARQIVSRVGPIGPFALEYEFRKTLPARLEDLIDRRTLTYRPSGWEIVPEFEGRGETYEAARRPISEFARVISRVTPGKATITFWVYPDSFDLYRKLRDDLQSRGYLVAGRPLPEGMAIRGGPGGSVSAGQ
jgi:chemotaxis protein histidine kinase CheA